MKTILVTGYAKSPQGSSINEVYKYIGVIIEIDIVSYKIVDTEIISITRLASDFFKRMFVGYDISRGIDDLIETINIHYSAPSKTSIIVATKSAYRRYIEHKEKYNI